MCGACIKGNKKQACCCLPLNYVGLGYGVILLIMNLVSFVKQLRALRQAAGDSKGAQVASIIFTVLPIICAVLSILGILLKKASLVRLAAKCIYPTILLIIVSIILVWVSISRSNNSSEDHDPYANVESTEKQLTTAYGVVCTIVFVIAIAILCYMLADLRSIATMLMTGQNPWVISQKPQTNEAFQQPTREPQTMISDTNVNTSASV